MSINGIELKKIIYFWFLFFFVLSISSQNSKVWFSPDDNISKKLIERIYKSQHRIYAAIFILTNKKVATALIEAKKRGVDVQFITDQGCLESLFGKVDMLKSAGIDLFIYKNNLKNKKYVNTIMHNKYAIFDELVWTGSFNWTVQAGKRNHENVICISDESVLKKYLKSFEHLKRVCKRLNRFKTKQEIRPGFNNKKYTESQASYKKRLVMFLKRIRGMF